MTSSEHRCAKNITLITNVLSLFLGGGEGGGAGLCSKLSGTCKVKTASVLEVVCSWHLLFAIHLLCFRGVPGQASWKEVLYLLFSAQSELHMFLVRAPSNVVPVQMHLSVTAS